MGALIDRFDRRDNTRERIWTEGANSDKSNGKCTNNVAEYKALDLLATRLVELDEHKDQKLVSMIRELGVLTIVGDSQGVINQMNGSYSVVQTHLVALKKSHN